MQERLGVRGVSPGHASGPAGAGADDDLASRIVREARSWIDTPFQGQQSCKGVGCDCKGLVVGVARALDMPEAQSRWARIVDYQSADGRLLIEGLAEMMDPVPDRASVQPGDLLLVLLRGKPQHLAIYTGENRMIHTLYSGPSRVRETPMGRLHWNAVHSIWRWRR